MRVQIRSIYDSSNITEIEVLEVPEVCVPLAKLSGQQMDFGLKNIRLQLSDPPNTGPTQISLLIGTGVYWKLTTGKIERLHGALVTVETRLGWTIQGPVATAKGISDVPTAHVMSGSDGT